MASNVFYIGLWLIALVQLRQRCVDASASASGGIHSATSAAAAAIADWFPEDFEFNESCVAEGCPQLKNMNNCPNDDWDIDALRDITVIISKCMRLGPICGMIMDPQPLKSLVVSTEEFLPGVRDIEGNSTLLPGTGFLSNMSRIQIEIPSQGLNGHLTLLIPNMRLHGRLRLDFRLETEQGPTLTASLKHTTYDIGIQFITTVSVNKTTNGKVFDIRFVNPVVKVQPLFCGIDMPSGFPDIQSLLMLTAQNTLEKSSIAKAIAKCLASLYRIAIQIVSNNCKRGSKVYH